MAPFLGRLGNGGGTIAGFGFGKRKVPGGAASLTATGGFLNGIQPGNGYKYHLFTDSGTFITGISLNIQVLVIGGGGGGGPTGAGAGAGGVVYHSNLSLSAGTYNITVGSGGYGGSNSSDPNLPNNGAPRRNGNTTSFDTLLIAPGGGAGGGMDEGWPSGAGDGQPGGSGGGSGRHYQNGTNPGGIASNPNANSGAFEYGNPGGSADPGNGQDQVNGGGGGAGGSGSPGPSNFGVGGSGYPFPAFASPLLPGMPTPWTNAVGPTGLYGGGGGGGRGRPSNPTDPTPGGSGGGGYGGVGSPSNPPNLFGGPGTDYTGGGGGGGGSGPGEGNPGGNGGKGVVIIRYLA
jgi:hypothetical protein